MFSGRHSTLTGFLSLAQLVCCAGMTMAVSAEEKAADYSEPPITESDRSHWAFQPLRNDVPPRHPFSAWRRNEIDDFVAAELDRHDLKPQPAAPGRVLLRRLALDVTGLPPHPDEVAQVEDRISETDYSELVDRQLATIAYGERWAQHWLDLARFAETDGFEHDKTRPDAWRYRDWVINALNSDMAYDEFLRRQIAGDELYPEDDSARTATRFCLSCPDMPDINLLEERRHTLLNEVVSTVGEVVLGLQVGCAQCHDHKFDPISQGDFYRLRAVFEPAIRLEKNKSLTTFRETFPWDRSSHLMIRGDFRRLGPEMRPGVLRVVSSDNAYDPQADGVTAGRRTALVKWLTEDARALTARVIVNRIWQHHFGKPIVDTPSDFGITGSEPTHPGLLDWLAQQLIDGEWKLKPLHRLILNSATWRQRSWLPMDAGNGERSGWRESVERDATGRLLSRYIRWRLEGETIRDAMLAAAGTLNRKRGGPGVRPPLPAELLKTLLKKQWVVTNDRSEHSRRSIYIFARRNLRYPIFEAFDRPSANASCGRRSESVTAPQSLHLLNSEFSLEVSRHLAKRLMAEHEVSSARVRHAFLRMLGRAPETAEAEVVAQFHADQQQLSDDETVALTHLCLSLFNSNEFIHVD